MHLRGNGLCFISSSHWSNFHYLGQSWGLSCAQKKLLMMHWEDNPVHLGKKKKHQSTSPLRKQHRDVFLWIHSISALSGVLWHSLHNLGHRNLSKVAFDRQHIFITKDTTSKKPKDMLNALVQPIISWYWCWPGVCQQVWVHIKISFP